MSAAPNTLAVTFYDGRAPTGQPATLIWSGSAVKVVGAAVDSSYTTRALRTSPRIGRADRFVSLPDGGQLHCPDHPLLDRLPQEDRTEGVVAWLEQRWQVAVAAIAITLGGLAAGYVYGLPAVAEHIAARVPLAYEQHLGKQTLAWLDRNRWLRPTTLAPQTQETLTTGFARLTRGLPMAHQVRLEFRNAPTIGPNAFALPGGIIVLTDQIVHLSKSPQEVYAVLAHELGHVARHHAMRHIVQDSVTAAAAATFTSDVSSLTFAVSGIPVLLAQTRYSRQFETEADDYAFALLKRRGISPVYFADLMQRLSASRDPHAEGRMAFLSTHPVTSERIARARAAAAGVPRDTEPDPPDWPPDRPNP